MSRWLEIWNAVWGMLGLQASFWLVAHLFHVGNLREMRPRDWLYRMPSAMRLGMAVLALAAGIFVSRAAIWWWRITTGGDIKQFSAQNPILILGAVLGSLGLIWIIRAVTWPRFGNWPWVIALISSVAYALARGTGYW